jgi:hypothetical protein
MSAMQSRSGNIPPADSGDSKFEFNLHETFAIDKVSVDGKPAASLIFRQ